MPGSPPVSTIATAIPRRLIQSSANDVKSEPTPVR